MKNCLTRLVLFFLVVCLSAATAAAQVTTGSLSGKVQNAQQEGVAGASVIAIHLPSGTTYETTSRADGRFMVVNMRVGGPYSVTVAYTGTGTAAFAPETIENVEVNLGVATDLSVVVKPIAVTETVTVTAQSDAIFASNRTGAATAVTRQELSLLPTISNRLESFARLTPAMGGSMSFAGQDNRMNNITIDGSYFNNSFGLGNQPGDRTNVAPISMDAIEQVQINIAPFDVRSGNFVGAGVNTVTRSGTNQFRGSAFYQFRDESLVGTEAKDFKVNPGTFSFKNYGGWGAGPIIKNRLFVFGNYEKEKTEQPGTTFRANSGGEAAGGSVTRVLASDLDRLSGVLQQRFKYDTGAYQDYAHLTPGRRLLAKFDANLSSRNKLSFRYNQLDSATDVLLSTSSSLGFGGRRSNLFGLNYRNSNYKILENIKSGVSELNSVIGSTMSNSLIVGFSSHDESRESLGTFFPLVDILQGGSVYTTFGFEPFTPNNELRYKTFQVQNNFTKFANRHSYTAGFSFERYKSENVFFPGSQSVYVYNSLQDFYDDIDRVRPVTLNRFQVRYNNIPGQDKPIQPLEVNYTGAYAQDEWTVSDRFKLIGGVRLDVPLFGDTAYTNANADALSFRDETGAAVRYKTGQLPAANILWSPRIGFNWDTSGDRTTQLRGGSGIFTGKPLFVWISNQIGNTGVLTGFIESRNTTAFPFNPDPNFYKPQPTGSPAASYELALTDNNFKFPQVWRTNVAVDRRLPWNIAGTAEFIYNRDVNGIYYIQANLPAPQTSFTGADNRPRWTSNRINNAPGNQISNATVMKNQNIGRSWNLVFSARKNARFGSLTAAYNYGQAKNTIDPGSISFGSWSNNAQSGDPNNPGLSYAGASPGHRFFLAGSFRREYFSFGATSIGAFWESRTIGNSSYLFSGDLNGDGASFNDLVYIPRDPGEMNFSTFTSGGRTYTAAEQAAAWEAFIAQDRYLSKHRGQYAQRGAVFLPLVHRLDLSLTQDLFKDISGQRHRFQFRVDVINFGNLLNKNWGVSQRLVSNTPLTNPGVDTQGRATYRLRVINNQLMSQSYQQTADLNDVYRIAFSLKYFFGS